MKSLVFYESSEYMPSWVALYIDDLRQRYQGGCKPQLIPVNVAYFPMTTQLFKYVNFQYINKTPAVVYATDKVCNTIQRHMSEKIKCWQRRLAIRKLRGDYQHRRVKYINYRAYDPAPYSK